MRSLFLFLLFPFCLQAQTWSDTAQLIDKLMKDRYAQDQPGCQLSVSRNGKVIFSKAYGMADMEHAIPMTLQAPTEAGSVSKQFTAAAVLMLQQQGKLSVHDDIHKYFPELPEYGDTMRISHLLHHTSGLRDWGAVAGITGWPRSTKTYSNDDALDIISRQRHLNFRPGSEYGYSNSNFNLLAILVQRLSGKSLADFTREHIFLPAGMTNTQWRDDHNRIVPGRVIAYDKQGEQFVTDMPNEDAYGNGGLLTTTEDLLKWQEFYLAGKLGGSALLRDQLKVAPLTNGTPNGYAAGLMLTFDGDRLADINHSGSTAGYRANLEHILGKNLTIAWLANSSLMDGAPKRVATMIKEVFEPVNAGIPLAKESNMQPRVQQDSLTASTRKWNSNEFVGTYHSDETNSDLSVWQQEGKLILHFKPGMDLEMVPVSTDGFTLKASNGNVFFLRDASGKPDRLQISVDRARKVEFIRNPQSGIR
jgi:CubicO group peptidase (beta-lactamase class C family)